jgi:hypothetical protein
MAGLIWTHLSIKWVKLILRLKKKKKRCHLIKKEEFKMNLWWIDATKLGYAVRTKEGGVGTTVDQRNCWDAARREGFYKDEGF